MQTKKQQQRILAEVKVSETTQVFGFFHLKVLQAGHLVESLNSSHFVGAQI